MAVVQRREATRSRENIAADVQHAAVVRHQLDQIHLQRLETHQPLVVVTLVLIERVPVRRRAHVRHCLPDAYSPERDAV